MEGDIRATFGARSDETTVTIASNCLNKTSHPGNGVPRPTHTTESPTTLGRDPCQHHLGGAGGCSRHLMTPTRGNTFQGKREQGSSLPPQFSFLWHFYSIREGWREEDCHFRLKSSLPQDHNLDAQNPTWCAHIHFFQKYCCREAIHFNYTPESSLETPISKSTSSPSAWIININNVN